MFSGDGGDITAIADEGSTLLIDSGVDSLVTELSDAIFKATKRPVTPLVNTHWHFDHTGGNVYFGSAGVTIVAQKKCKKAAVVPAVRAVHWFAGRPLSAPGTASCNLFKQRDIASRCSAVGIGQLRTCAHGRRNGYLYRSGERRSGRDMFSNHFYPSLI
jgi:glyoxylase-like metal-dependent hydrolase (beta-lactamase superfamily II)